MFSFEVEARSGARRGRLATARGAAETPTFMPVGTLGAVKGMTTGELAASGVRILLANTYHLFLRPGHELVRSMGGLHRFMNWSGSILTDSGGFQVFSLAGLRRIDDEGVRFTSHLDGSPRHLTPETSMEVQSFLGSDVAMALDECPALPAPREAVEVAVDRTTRWARRCREAYRGPGALFGIVQGGGYLDLRDRSAAELLALDFPGYAIGGVSVGEPADAVSAVVRHTAALLPTDRPRYLMGVGTPSDLVAAVAAGCDLFDCVLPTRNARNGQLFTRAGRLHIRNAKHRQDPRPPEEGCACYTCRTVSRAYLRHLHLSDEITGATLMTVHNLHHYLDTLRRMRQSIVFGRFAEFREDMLRSLATEPAGDA